MTIITTTDAIRDYINNSEGLATQAAFEIGGLA